MNDKKQHIRAVVNKLTGEYLFACADSTYQLKENEDFVSMPTEDFADIEQDEQGNAYAVFNIKWTGINWIKQKTL